MKQELNCIVQDDVRYCEEQIAPNISFTESVVAILILVSWIWFCGWLSEKIGGGSPTFSFFIFFYLFLGIPAFLIYIISLL